MTQQLKIFRPLTFGSIRSSIYQLSSYTITETIIDFDTRNRITLALLY